MRIVRCITICILLALFLSAVEAQEEQAAPGPMFGEYEPNAQGAGGAQNIIASIVPKFEFYLSGYSFNFKKIAAVPQNRDIFFRLDGMLGGDIFNKGKVRIDFTNGRLDVSLPATALLAQK